jgi:hypothetical protein
MTGYWNRSSQSPGEDARLRAAARPTATPAVLTLAQGESRIALRLHRSQREFPTEAAAESHGQA